jgi:aldose 1-epimerase
VVVLDAGDVVAEVEPRYGSNLCVLRYRGDDLVRCDRELLRRGRWTGIPVLWPFPNRVRGKEYRFGRRTVSLASVVRPEGNWPLVHGLVDDLPWESAPSGGGRVRTWIDWLPSGSPASERFTLYPFPSRLTLEVDVGGDGLRVSYRVDNLGEGDLPFAFALHPYFTLLDGARSEVLVPADAVMEADEDLLPSGRLLPVDGTGCDLRRPVAPARLQLDHVFTRLRPGAPCLVRHPARGIELVSRASDDFTHVVLYTMKAASEGFVCLENQTSSTDAVNLHARAVETADAALAEAAHLLVVPPGASHAGWIDYRVRPIGEDGGGGAGGTVSA